MDTSYFINKSVDMDKGEARVRTMYTPSMVVTRVASKMWPRNRTKSTLDDMVYFHHLHEPAIVNNIMVRYLKQHIYTFKIIFSGAGIRPLSAGSCVPRVG